MRFNAQGVKATKQFLTVYFVIEVGVTVRFAEVRVPLFMLTTDEVHDAIDKQYARELKAAWQEEVETPLFVVD